MQNNRPIPFYSRKLNPTQCNYTTGEQELLSIVKTVKQYQNIVLGYDIKVLTDHKTALFKA
jgi:RNase H-like domain found in reverse transcriptase